MKVLVFALTPLWSPHFETELELVAKHESAGDEVIVVTCRGALQSCLANPFHNGLDCISCRSKCSRGLDAIGFDVSSVDKVEDGNWLDHESELPSTGFASIEDLRSFEVQGVPIGNAAASSLTSIIRDSNPRMIDHIDLVERLLMSASQMATTAVEAIRQHQPGLVYVFNGRFATTAPIVAVCERLGVPFRTHESWYTEGQYLLVESATVHDLHALKMKIEECWTGSDLNEQTRSARAKEFYEHRRFGGDGSGPEHLRFSSSQIRGRLPEFAAEYVAILNSSEDEFTAMTQYDNPVYRNQMAALEAILDEPQLRDTRFILRVHPNLVRLESDQTRHLATLENRTNLKIVQADDQVDTYSLIDSAHSVVTFGSTTGIEAVYWGVPSILIGRAPYEGLGPVNPMSHREVVELILHPPPPAPVEGALKYGYFLLEGGQRFEHYRQVGYYGGRVNGTRIRANWVARNAVRVRNRMRQASDGMPWNGRSSDNRALSQR